MDAEAMVVRGVFATVRGAEVRFGVGMLDDFSVGWDALPDSVKDKWRYIARMVKGSLR